MKFTNFHRIALVAMGNMTSAINNPVQQPLQCFTEKQIALDENSNIHGKSWEYLASRLTSKSAEKTRGKD